MRTTKSWTLFHSATGIGVYFQKMSNEQHKTNDSNTTIEAVTMNR